MMIQFATGNSISPTCMQTFSQYMLWALILGISWTHPELLAA